MTKNKVFKHLFGPWAAIGLAFLVIPSVSLYDVMPDFIGWILLWVAVSELSYFSTDIDTAGRMTTWLSLVSGVTCVAGILMIGSIGSQEIIDTNNFMTAVTVSVICEIICAVLYGGALFNGLENLSSLNGGEKALKAIANARFLCRSFLVVRAVLRLVPELFTLAQMNAYNDIDNIRFWEGVYALRLPATLLCMLVSFAFGIYFYTGMLRMFKAIRSDDSLISSLTERVERESERNEARNRSIRVSTACALMTAAVVLFFNVILDYKYLNPQFVSVILVLAAAYVLKEGNFGGVKKLAVPAFVLSAVSYVFRLTISGNYFRYVSLYAAYVAFPLTTRIFMAVTGVATAVVMFCFIKAMYDGFCDTVEVMTARKAEASFVTVRVVSSLSLLVNAALFVCPPSREALAGVDVLLSVLWIILHVRLTYKFKDEVIVSNSLQ